MCRIDDVKMQVIIFLRHSQLGIGGCPGVGCCLQLGQMYVPMLLMLGQYERKEIEPILKEIFYQQKGEKIDNAELVQIFKDANFDTSQY